MREMSITLRYEVPDEVQMHQGVHVAHSLSTYSRDAISEDFRLVGVDTSLWDIDAEERVNGPLERVTVEDPDDLARADAGRSTR